MLWQAMVTHHDFQLRQHTMLRTRRKTKWNYNRDMIIDKPRENMNKNYESYLQLDRIVYSLWVHPSLRCAARRAPCSNILNSVLNPRIRDGQEVINAMINAPQYYKLWRTGKSYVNNFVAAGVVV